MELKPLFQNIASAIREKDGSTEGIAASAFPERIRALPAQGTALTPEEVYAATRPKDWLAMPTPEENEMYLLLHIPDGKSELLAFVCGASSDTGSYTVTLGTAANGAFVPSAAVEPVSVAYGTNYETELAAADWGDLTADGDKQVMVKVSGAKAMKMAAHSAKPEPEGYVDWNVVEIWAANTKVTAGTSSAAIEPYKALQSLRYFNYAGSHVIGAIGGTFQNCRALMTVLGFPTAIRTAGALFVGCTSLCAIPPLTAANPQTRIFDGCTAISRINVKSGATGLMMNQEFKNCYSLRSLTIDVKKIVSLQKTFENCISLRELQGLPVAATTMEGAFDGCASLERLTFDPTVADWAGADFSIAGCKLGHSALVELFESLPTITEQHTITLTGNPGVGELTEADRAIAAGKNWALAE